VQPHRGLPVLFRFLDQPSGFIRAENFDETGRDLDRRIVVFRLEHGGIRHELRRSLRAIAILAGFSSAVVGHIVGRVVAIGKPELP